MLKFCTVLKCNTFLDSCILRVVKFPPLKHFVNYSFCKLENPAKSPLQIRMQNHFKTWSVMCSEESDAPEENPIKSIDPSKDRTKVIAPETSIRYMKSEAYKSTYGDEAVWVKYRRNFKGQFVPRKTRKSCTRKGVISTGNPCPICRDEYLVLHYTNVDLLKQFICPETGEMYSSQKIHVCQKKLLQLEVAIKKAKFYGLLLHEVPFRNFNYCEYYPDWKT